ncbi:MAG: DUF1659 domain-containing protein [Thermoanaerobacteraceae bacterium]|jgi:hypothetical protein|nr:DUF1659 domain-containing protein [Thermoanaerobacteraceae bacterium]
MAIVATPLNSSLRIIVETGVDENNKPIYRTRSYNNVKTDATDEDLMSVANQLADIQSHPVHAIRRTIESELTEVV